MAPRKIVPQPRRHAVVAAASRLDLSKKHQAQVRAVSDTQEQAWRYFDLIGEVKAATWLMGNQLGKVRLYVATLPPGATEPVPATDPDSGIPPALAAAAEAELARLRGPLGGQGELIRELCMNLDVAGEAYLVGRGARPAWVDERGVKYPEQAETWEVRSCSELESKGKNNTVVKSAPGDKGVKLDPELDTVIRLWQRHPRWSELPDCHLFGALGECAALVTLHHQLLAESRSRHHAGVFTLPNELSSSGPLPAEQDVTDDTDDPLTRELHEAWTDPVDHSDHAGAAAPTLLRGPAEFLTPNHVRWIESGRGVGAELDARIEGRVQRLARSLNMPVEYVMGHQLTTYANAEQTDDDLFADYMAPRAELIVDGITVGFLRPQLTDEANRFPEADVARLFVWYDPGELVPKADEAEMVERLATTAQKLYLAVGTVLTQDEARQIMADAGAELGDVLPVKLDAAAPSPTEGEVAAAVTARALVASAGPTPLGRHLVDVDRDLRSRLLALADAVLARALERAGNRLRSRAEWRQTLRMVPAHLAGATLGPTLVATAFTDDELLADAFAPMKAQFYEWGAAAQAEAIDSVGRFVSGFTVSERSALQLRQAADLDEAWGWLERHLTELAGARLYDPLAAADAVGEVVAGLAVPPGLIRQAMAIAGGAVGIETSASGGAWVAVTDAGTRPVGGIATGELVRDLLRSHGVQTEAYRWVYGPAARSAPFEPHRALNDRTFTSFDDPVLANHSGWPPFAFYMPGDHRGCLCDFEPVLIAPDGTVTPDNA